MTQFIAKVMVAAAPVYGVCIGIAVLRAAHLPFPPVLSVEAWPQWVVFCAVVHSVTALCLFIANRLGASPPPGASKALA